MSGPLMEWNGVRAGVPSFRKVLASRPRHAKISKGSKHVRPEFVRSTTRRTTMSRLPDDDLPSRLSGEPRARPASRRPWAGALSASSSVLLALLVAGLLLCCQEYEATATLGTTRSRLDRDGATSFGDRQENWLRSPIDSEAILSDRVLDEALSMIGSRESSFADGRDEPRAELRDGIAVLASPGGASLRVIATTRDRGHAAIIANAVADAYVRQSRSDREEQRHEYRRVLTAQAQEVRREVELRRHRQSELLERMRQGSSTRGIGASGPMSRLPPDGHHLDELTRSLIQTELQLVQAAGEIDAHEASLEGIRRKFRSSPTVRDQVIAEFRRDADVRRLIERVREAGDDLDRLKSTAGPGSDESQSAEKRLKAIKDDYESAWSGRSEEIRARLQEQAESETGKSLAGLRARAAGLTAARDALRPLLADSLTGLDGLRSIEDQSRQFTRELEALETSLGQADERVAGLDRSSPIAASEDVRILGRATGAASRLRYPRWACWTLAVSAGMLVVACLMTVLRTSPRP